MSRIHRSRVAVEIPGRPELYNPSALPEWEVVGTVADAAGTGALVRNRQSGTYCRANQGELSSLPQRKIEAALAALQEGRS